MAVKGTYAAVADFVIPPAANVAPVAEAGSGSGNVIIG
jgi:hypothetical protein